MLARCAVNPVTGERVDVFGPEKNVELAASTRANRESLGWAIDDENLQSYVNRVGQRSRGLSTAGHGLHFTAVRYKG